MKMRNGLYWPVSRKIIEEIDNAISNKDKGTLYYHEENILHVEYGKITNCIDVKNKGVYAVINNCTPIRLDKVISFNKKEGPAFEDYRAGISCQFTDSGDKCYDCKYECEHKLK